MGFQNSASRLELVFYAARSYSLMRPPRTARRLIFSWEVSATGWSGRGGWSWPVRAENRIHGSDQQSCSPDALPVMITGHVPAVGLPSHHAGEHVAAAIPASRGMEDRRDLDPAPPVGFLNSATGVELGFYAACSYSLMRPPRTGRRLIRSWERSAGGWSGLGGCSWLWGSITRSCQLTGAACPLC